MDVTQNELDGNIDEKKNMNTLKSPQKRALGILRVITFYLRMKRKLLFSIQKYS